MVGSEANAVVTVKLPGRNGSLTTGIWKDISLAPDERVKICLHSVAGYYGDTEPVPTYAVKIDGDDIQVASA